jgi:hypothetical protein
MSVFLVEPVSGILLLNQRIGQENCSARRARGEEGKAGKLERPTELMPWYSTRLDDEMSDAAAAYAARHAGLFTT